MTSPIAQELATAIDAAGWRTHPAPDPVSADAYLGVLRVLYATGRQDLPLGRLLEGHVDAVQIVQRLGTPEQVARLHARIAAGRTIGVWNAALPGDALRIEEGRLHGGKSFASGAGVLDLALVTADTPHGAQLLLLDLSQTPPAIDSGWWRTTGMLRSETHRVRWSRATIDPADVLGSPGDYAREPWFSGGALRFVAVHAGGVAGIFDRTRDHLQATGRGADPFQVARLAELFGLADGAAAAVARTARLWFEERDETRLPRVASTRMVVLAAAERAMTLAREAVGVQAMFVEHPLSAMLSDLDVYLRQPVPDVLRQRVGHAAAAGDLVPHL